MPDPQSHVVRATLSDQASHQDLLGYGPYVASLGQLLTQRLVATPFVVGVFGPWGTGKSSFMFQLHDELEQEDLPAVWFQPWLFDEKEEVWKALILSILQYLEDKTEDKQQLTRIKSLVVGVGKVALNQVLSKATGLDLTVEQIAQAYSNTSSDNTRFINTFRRDFAQVKEAVLSGDSNPNSRLYVFVDDLDRCTPENCVRVLEAIRLFFDFEGCIFILGIDQEVVQKGIEIKYDPRLRMRGRDYLDKLIQLPFTLPSISEESFDSFVRATTEPFEFEPSSKKLIALASERNPRRLKRLSNCLGLLRTAAGIMARNGTDSEPLGSPDAERYLAFLLALQVRFPIANRWLVENLEYLGDKDFMSQSKGELVSRLENSYDPATANDVAEEALSFVSRAQREDLITRSWKGKEVFVRLTAVVEASSSKAESPKKLVIDSQYAETTSTDVEPVPEPPAQVNGEKQKEQIDDLARQLEIGLDSLDSIIDPRITMVLLGVTDRHFVRATECLAVMLANVEALEKLDPTAVPTRARVITDGGAKDQLMGLASYLKGIGLATSWIGTLLLAISLTLAWIELRVGPAYISESIHPLAVWPPALFALGVLLRGLMVVTSGRQKLRELTHV